MAGTPSVMPAPVTSKLEAGCAAGTDSSSGAMRRGLPSGGDERSSPPPLGLSAVFWTPRSDRGFPVEFRQRQLAQLSTSSSTGRTSGSRVIYSPAVSSLSSYANCSRAERFGVIWALATVVRRRGDPFLSDLDLEAIRDMIPTSVAVDESLPVIAAVTEALSLMPGGMDVLREWAEKENRSAGRSGVPQHPLRVNLSYRKEATYTFCTWSLALRVASKFVALKTLPSESEFFASLVDVYYQAAGDGWMLDTMVQALFVYKDLDWLWSSLF